MNPPKLTTGRRERKREQTKQGLLQAAFNLFIEKGYDETTVDDIVAAADAAKMTFYYHFRSKEDIILEMKRHTAAETLGRARKMLDNNESAIAAFAALIADLTNWTEKNWRVLEVFAAQRFAPHKGKGYCEGEDTPPLVLILEAIITQGQKSGEFRNEIKAVEVAHFLTLGIMNEYFMWIRQGRQKGALKPSMERCVDFILHGLQNRHKSP